MSIERARDDGRGPVVEGCLAVTDAQDDFPLKKKTVVPRPKTRKPSELINSDGFQIERAWQESNLRPSGPEPDALSPELHAQLVHSIH